MHLKDLKKINMIHALIYPTIFVLVSLIFINFGVTTGNPVLDVAVNMLVTGIVDVFITFEVHARGKKH